MKRVFKLTLCAVIVFIAMAMSKKVNAAEGKLADVKYAENTDGTVKVTMTFSEEVEKIKKLANAGWTLSGKTATKNMNPGDQKMAQITGMLHLFMIADVLLRKVV